MVETDDGIVEASSRGRLRLSRTDTTNPVAIGDRVSVTLTGETSAVIEEIHPRDNALCRRAAGRKKGMAQIIAANVDFAWIVASVVQPRINPGLIDRFLVMAEADKIPAGIIINKIDLANNESSIFEWHDLYEGIGYPVLLTSAITGEGISGLRQSLKERVTLFTGMSGVGKSSLLNKIDKTLNLPTGEVSAKTNKGRHITTFSTAYPFQGGYLIDTPGIREFGIVEVSAEELSHYFIEFRPFLDECRFPNCTHAHEPDCAVADALDAGEISGHRYASYLNILDSLLVQDDPR